MLHMPGRRTHAEWSHRMLAEYGDETAKMLPGFDQVFNTDKARGALYWASNTPDWYNFGKFLNDLDTYVETVKNAFVKTNIAVNGTLDSARRGVNEAIGDVIRKVNDLISKLPVDLPKIPDVPPIPQLPQVPVLRGQIATLDLLLKKAGPLTPGDEDLAHWVPFCREYAEHLRSQGISDPYAQAFFLGVVAHVMEDIPFHFDGPEWPTKGYGEGVYIVDRVQGDPSQGKRPVITFFEKRVEKIGVGEPRIDEYLIGSSPQNSAIHNDIVASWPTLPTRLEELQAVYRRVGLPSGRTSTLAGWVEMPQETWQVE